MVIKIGDRSKALTDITIEPQGLVVLGSGDLPVQLRNSGQTVQLLYTDGELIDEVAYGTATKAHSYAYFEDGWLWTKSATRGEENVFIAIAEPSKPGPIAPQSTKKSATKPKSTSKTTAPSTAKKGVVAGAMAKAAQPPQNPPAQEQLPTAATDEEKQPTKDLSRYLGWLLLGTATVGGGMFGVYKYGFKKQLPF